MEWKQLLSEGRQRQAKENEKRQKETTDLRSEFEKDYHRIVGSASFRRLQDKTQVFPLDQSDFIRTRLTHSLEVSSFAKSLGQNIGENILICQKDRGFTAKMKEDICNILQCAGLIHDIGNPPFGHFGEMAIRDWFKENLDKIMFKGQKLVEILSDQMREDLYHFEGNAQAFRLVTKLHYLVDERGMNLTYALLGSIIKYPVSSVEIGRETGNIKDKKLGYYLADSESFCAVQKETGTNGKRHPLAFILEAADDIAYKTADMEDAFIKGFFSYHTICEELEGLTKEGKESQEQEFDALGKLQALYQRAKERGEENPEEYAIKNWIVRVQAFLIRCATTGFTSHYKEIMDGEYEFDLFHGTSAERIMDLLGDFAYRRVFTSRQIHKMEMTEAVILNDLMDKFVSAIVYYDVEGYELNAYDMRLVSFISDNYKKAYHFHGEGKSEVEKLYLRLLLVTDYICGMTDSYAKRLYQELKGII